MSVGSALQVSSVDVQRNGDYIDFSVHLDGFSSPHNTSIRLYYIFEQDMRGENPLYTAAGMDYNEDRGCWEASIPKKYDASTVHYIVNVTDYGAENMSELYAEYAGEYTYTTPFSIQYTPCIVGGLILFAAFEVLMHYGRRVGYRANDGPETEKDEGDVEEKGSE